MKTGKRRIKQSGQQQGVQPEPIFSRGNVTVIASRDGRIYKHTFENVEFAEMNGAFVIKSTEDAEQDLFGYMNGEAYLGNGLAQTKRASRTVQTPWFAKTFFKDARGFMRVALENPPYPTYATMPGNKVLDTQDVARRAGCSAITVLRHVRDGRLKTHGKGSSSREFYYVKRDVEEWLKQTAGFKRGRPAKQK